MGAPAPGTSPPIVSVARVLVHGLYQRTELNGQFGIVLGDSEQAGGRYLLRIQDTGKTVSIKGCNFTRSSAQAYGFR